MPLEDLIRAAMREAAGRRAFPEGREIALPKKNVKQKEGEQNG